MIQNMGDMDRLIRAIIAVVIAGAWFTGLINGLTALILGIIAVILMVTALVGFCPLYTLFGRPRPGNVAT